jgi:hypothetical protein
LQLRACTSFPPWMLFVAKPTETKAAGSVQHDS